MTFNELFTMKDLTQDRVDLTLNKNFVCPYFEEDFDSDEDELFSMEMKREYAGKFIDYLSQKYKTMDRLIKHLESNYITSYDGFTDLFFIFAMHNLRIEMTLYDYYNKYKFDESMIRNHIGYAIDLVLEENGKTHGVVHIDDCILELQQNFGLNYLRIRSYSPTDVRINLDKKSLIKQIKIYFIEMI